MLKLIFKLIIWYVFAIIAAIPAFFGLFYFLTEFSHNTVISLTSLIPTNYFWILIAPMTGVSLYCAITCLKKFANVHPKPEGMSNKQVDELINDVIDEYRKKYPEIEFFINKK